MVILETPAESPDAAVIARAVEVLRAGGVVAYPTDTLYGLAVDPRWADAASRLYAAKGREASVASPLVAASIDQVREAAIVGERERRLAEAFWPGPLTIVMPARPAVSPSILGGGTTVAVRVPSHAVARALCAAFGFPLTATSANWSGQPPAASAADVVSAFPSGVDLLIDAGAAAGGLPSTIVEFGPSGPRLVRAGAVPWERVLRSLE
jgi:L-threonylcarbamoyladenylate synthase